MTNNLNNLYRTFRNLDKVEMLESENETAKESDNRIRKYIGAIGHEIRGPLNGLIGFCELIKDNPTTENVTNFMPYILSSAQKTLAISSLIRLASSTLEELKLLSRDIDVTESVKANIIPYTHHLDKIGINLYHNGPTKITTNQEMFEFVIGTKLGDAVKYGKEGKMINIGITNNENSIKIQIENDIAKEKKDGIVTNQGLGTFITDESIQKMNYTFENYTIPRVDTSKKPTTFGNPKSTQPSTKNLFGLQITIPRIGGLEEKTLNP
ncbi:MAG: hypothetical protein PF542_03170 [Nanoarchaeota archaeon]|jgi:signal transduction histidine kinase|nr:hypothetical protein [Nanoarchaeota archaeon]